MYADTFRSPELRHEVPLGIPDPFLYAEQDGVKHIAIGSMEIPRLAALGLFELHPGEEYGADELIRSGLSYQEVRQEVALRAVKGLGISSAVVPETFPLWLADQLRANDVEQTVDYYRDVVGFGLMAQLGDQTAFLSAGGYHHHLGGNTWQSAGRPYAPEGYARLTQMTIVLPDEASRDAVAERLGGVEASDPSGIPVSLAV